MPIFDDEVLHENEMPDEADLDTDGSQSADAEPCPSCGQPVYHDAARCPHCGDWITFAGEADRRSRTWLWPIVVVLVLVGFALLIGLMR